MNDDDNNLMLLAFKIVLYTHVESYFPSDQRYSRSSTLLFLKVWYD
jgi:hypothetical protein